MKIAIVRGKFLNKYEMQVFEPLTKQFDITAFGSLHPYHEIFAFPVIRLPSPMDLPEFPYKMPILNRLFVDAHYLLGLEQNLKDFDLIHSAETYFHYTQQCLNAKKKGYVKKVIATVLENIPFNNEGIWGRKMFKKRAREELDHIIALTQKTRDALVTEGTDSSKITVVSHFIDTQRFIPAKDTLTRISDSKKKSFTLLFVGRLEEYKGVFDIVEAVKILLSDPKLKTHDLHFLFVGNGTQKDSLRSKIQEYGIEKYIEILSVSYDEIPQIYKKADIFLAPSKTRYKKTLNGTLIPTYEEQYCTALLEAQASGLPIVTTRSGGIPENIGDAGILVTPGDSQELAQAIKNYILDSKLRMSFAQKARKRAEAVHDIHVGAKKLAQLYKTIINL